MLILFALPVIAAVAAMHRYLQFYAPTNMLSRRVRAREPRWRTAALLLVTASTLVAATHTLGEAVVDGAPGWLNFLVLVLAWDAIKMAVLAMAQAVACAWRALARQSSGRTSVRRRAVPVDGRAAHRVCA